MNPVKLIIHLGTAILSVTFCACCVDNRLAAALEQISRRSPLYARTIADLPDLLALFVCCISLVSLVCYAARARSRLFDTATWTLRHVAYTAPLAFAAKSLAKYLFGRVTTRAWLVRPELSGFHWFQGGGDFGGFPSGHMTVFTALAAALWRFYPRCRPAGLIFLLLLAAALVASNYHFLGDVIAGAYLGLFVEACTDRLLHRISPPATP